MEKAKREIVLFFMGNVYLLVYYLLAVLANKAHPMDAYAPLMIVGSFFGLPLLMFIVIPIINGRIVGKKYKVKMTLRIVVYIILSMPLLHGLFNVHMAVSNHLVKNELFPEGVEAVALKHFNELEEITNGEIQLLSYKYIAPYHSSINAGNMSGTSNPSIDIEYVYPSCSTGDCKQIHYVEYDLDTGKPIKPNDSKAGIPQPLKEMKWAEEFVGEYIGAEDGLRYTIFMIDHATDGEKLNFRRYEPYFNIDALIQQTEPSYAEGIIKEAQSDNPEAKDEADAYLAGKTVEFIKAGDQVEVWIDEVLYASLILTERR